VLIEDELVIRLNGDAWPTWDAQRLTLLSQLEPGALAIADRLRQGIRAARGFQQVGAWIRDPMQSGFFGMLDYTSWHHDALDAALADASAPIMNIGETVWTALTESGDAFDTFLDQEPRRASGIEAFLFPGNPLVSVSERVAALDPPGSTVRRQALDHCIDAANVLAPGRIQPSDLKALSYNELLVVLDEIQAVDVTSMAPLAGARLREQVLLRLDELAPVAHQALEDLEDWQESNYSDYSHALQGEVPSTAFSDWWLGLLPNAVGEFAEAVIGLTGAAGLEWWLAGAGTAVEPGVGTVVGFALGLSCSIVATNLLTDTEADQIELITHVAQKILKEEQTWLDKVRQATAEASATLDELVARARLLADPFTDDATLRKLYADVLADLALLPSVIPPAADRSLSNAHLMMWLFENGWGFMPYDDRGSLAPRASLLNGIRTRVLTWSTDNNELLFISQCEYEWRSLGFPVNDVLRSMRAESTWFADINRTRFDNRAFTFYGYLIAELFRRKWSTRYSFTLSTDNTASRPFEPGVTYINDRGIRELLLTNWTVTCTIRLDTRRGSCFVTAFEYHLEGGGDFFADIVTAEGPDSDLAPSAFVEYTVVPDIPAFTP
jgi:hypothetical protein